jgi:hypothetical protein
MIGLGGSTVFSWAGCHTWTNILSKVNQVLLLMANHLIKMQVLSRLSKV